MAFFRNAWFGNEQKILSARHQELLERRGHFQQFGAGNNVLGAAKIADIRDVNKARYLQFLCSVHIATARELALKLVEFEMQMTAEMKSPTHNLCSEFSLACIFYHHSCTFAGHTNRIFTRNGFARDHRIPS